VAPPSHARCFTNFKHAKWGLWTSETEAGFAAAPEPTSCSEGEQVFRKILLKASGHYISAGFRKYFVPGIPKEAVDPTKEHDRLRELDPLDPWIQLLNQRITESVNTEARKLWQEEVEANKPRNNPEKFWKLPRNISGKRQNQPPNQPIHFGTTCFSKPQTIANRFCKQYANVSTHKTNPQAHCMNRRLKKQHPIDHSFQPFTAAATKFAIEKSSNSTAKGPDGLESLHLKFLGPLGIDFLTKLYNLSVTHANILVVWKRANIVPIPKPGKPSDVSTSYRPISLLSSAVIYKT
jgi:hypothetical protein